MKTEFALLLAYKSRIVVVALICAGWLSVVHAAHIQPIGGLRTVEISGDLNAFNYETNDNFSTSFKDDDHGESGEWGLLQTGMDLALPEGNFFGQGSAMQSIVNTGGTLVFRGLADVNISAFPSYPYILEGSGAAHVELDYQFDLSGAESVDLFMASETAPFQEDDYQFQLMSDDGRVVWAQTAIIDGNGDVQNTFTERLALNAGRYSLKVLLKANSQVTNDIGFAGRTRAEFSITVVPEPATWLLMLYGAGLVPFLLRRTRQ